MLVLNASYEPINVCAARRAIVLVLKGVAMTEEENGHFLHAARVAMRVPSVIRLLEYRRIPHQSRALSRRTFCCATATPASIAAHAPLRRTYARPRHSALPRWPLHLGKSGGLLPSLQPPQGQSASHEANMKPSREPRSFNLHTSRHIMRLMGHSDDKWRKYLFY